LALPTRRPHWLQSQPSIFKLDESDPIVESVDFAAVIGLPLDADRHEDTTAEDPAGPDTGRADDGAAAESPDAGDGKGITRTAAAFFRLPG
jgi:hypothetical protein